MADNFTQADLDNLNAAIAAGLKKARLNNREVEYQSITQMTAAARYIKAALNGQEEIAGKTPRRPRVYRARCKKGY